MAIQSMVICSNCRIDVAETWKCNSCSHMVCGNCMPVAGSCCVECQLAFPAPPSTHKRVEPFRLDLPCCAHADRYVPSFGQLDQFLIKGPSDEMAIPQLHGCDPQAGRLRDYLSCLKTFPPNDSNHYTTTPIVDALSTCPEQVQVSQATITGIVQNAKTPIEHTLDKPCMERPSGALDAFSQPKALGLVGGSGKHKDSDGKGRARTMMICNIPCRVGYDDLVDAIDYAGFGGTYEFLHLPFRHGQTDSNLGYGFINFFHDDDAESFAMAFEGYRFFTSGSTKVCTVKVATCQGYNANYRRTFRKSRQMGNATA